MCKAGDKAVKGTAAPWAVRWVGVSCSRFVSARGLSHGKGAGSRHRYSSIGSSESPGLPPLIHLHQGTQNTVFGPREPQGETRGASGCLESSPMGLCWLLPLMPSSSNTRELRAAPAQHLYANTWHCLVSIKDPTSDPATTGQG